LNSAARRWPHKNEFVINQIAPTFARMRKLAALAIVVIAQIGAAFALGEANTARPGATFATIEAETPAACERLCSDDTLCMAWSFHGNACELKAVVPRATAQDGAFSGISTRAPASLRARPEPQPLTALRDTTEPEPELAAAAPPPEDDTSMALLGGPLTAEHSRAPIGN
jgi:hypothetical protein